MTLESIKNNFEIINENIRRAAVRAGRDLDSIRLVAVSKRKPLELVEFGYQAGLRDFGENYPEEAVDKIIAGQPDIRWHMIGHIQTRKARIVADHFSMVHTIDSLHTAQKLNQLLDDQKRQIDCLLEINIGGEKSKHGYSLESSSDQERFHADIEQMIEAANLHLCGIMVMPPFTEEAESSRIYFRKARIILDGLKKKYPDMDWRELSMGTSQDFEVAIEEGATIVRIGTAIFGERI
jgi:PLP dependent protein